MKFKKGDRVKVTGAEKGKEALVGKTGVVDKFGYGDNGDLYGVKGLGNRAWEVFAGIHAFTADQLRKV